MRTRNQKHQEGHEHQAHRRWDGPPEAFGFGGSRRGRRGGPGRRARRGDVRAAALALLTERPMHGYEMIQELEERTDGVWRPSPGAVYPALQLLEDQGLVTADADAGKRLFSLTDTGREEAAKLGDRKPWDDVTAGIDPSQFKLRDALGPIAVAARQVAIDGTPAQQAAAAEVLTETRRKLYAILAEAPAATSGSDSDDG
jgi:DNA-binding PadR family transcriptional regulator